jgi:hypothetical protein
MIGVGPERVWEPKTSFRLPELCIWHFAPRAIGCQDSFGSVTCIPCPRSLALTMKSLFRTCDRRRSKRPLGPGRRLRMSLASLVADFQQD